MVPYRYRFPFKRSGTLVLAGGLAAFGAHDALAATPDLGAAPVLDVAGQTAVLPAVVLRGTTGLDKGNRRGAGAAPAAHGNVTSAAMADLDGDGDLDLVAGTDYGAVLYFENTGSSSEPFFVQQTGAANPFDGFNAGSYSAPAVADVDGDGDLDAVVGAGDGSLTYFLNTGNAATPVMVEQTGGSDPFAAFVPTGNFSVPALGDLDNDSDPDLIIGDATGAFRTFRNNGGAPASFTELTGAANPLKGEDVGTYSAPALADLDNDGDLDVTSGRAVAGVVLYRNTGTPAAAAFTFKGSAGAFAVPNKGALPGAVSTYSVPSFGDLDGDGDQDLLVGDSDWANGTKLYRNIGTPAAPKFNQAKRPATLPRMHEVWAEEEVVELQWDGDVFAPADEVLPTDMGLEAPYPNPVQARAWIPFRLPESASVRLAVYDVLGREVARLVDGVEPAGRHQALFEAQGLPAGFYLIKMEAEGREEVRSLILNR